MKSVEVRGNAGLASRLLCRNGIRLSVRLRLWNSSPTNLGTLLCCLADRQWVESICDWTKARIPDINRIVIGIPSYVIIIFSMVLIFFQGYSGVANTYSPNIHTKAQSQSLSGF